MFVGCVEGGRRNGRGKTLKRGRGKGISASEGMKGIWEREEQKMSARKMLLAWMVTASLLWTGGAWAQEVDSDGDGLSDALERGVGRYEIVQAPTTNGWTWHEAKADAEARGGHLATITSEAEWVVISNMFGTNVLGCWLGGTDEEEEGVWKWVTGEPWGYTRWWPSQPDDQNGGQNYLAFHGAYGTRWDDGSIGPVSKYLFERGCYTDSMNADTDGDGVPDGDEYELGRSPVVNEAEGTANEVVSVDVERAGGH